MKTYFLNALSKDARYQLKGQLRLARLDDVGSIQPFEPFFLQEAKINLRVKTNKEKQNTVEQNKKVDR